MKVLKTLKVVFVLIIFGIIMRVFIGELFLIPSTSMHNTILDGDFVIVSKLHYGSRIWFNKNGGVVRMFPLNQPRHNDIIAFNYPLADTIYSLNSEINFNFNSMKRGRKNALYDTAEYGSLKYISISGRQTYIKRCIALPGDIFEMRLGDSFINGCRVKSHLNIIQNLPPRYKNYISIPSRRFPSKKENNPKYWQDANAYRIIFPNNYVYRWNHDIFGPIVIPKKGVSVLLNYSNIWLYKRIIETYEHNKLNIMDSGIYINGKIAKQYTFKMNYYFMLGDNRKNSKDSMFWGFVPEDHIIGKAIMITFSYGIEESEQMGIRWNRLFKVIE